jgi:hypothetical protein
MTVLSITLQHSGSVVYVLHSKCAMLGGTPTGNTFRTIFNRTTIAGVHLFEKGERK